MTTGPARHSLVNRSSIGAALLIAAAVGERHAQEHVGQYARADIEFGASLYNGACVTCHGPNGDAVPGVDLRSGRFRHASSDVDLQRIIRNGLPDTPMPPGEYNAAELVGLVAFVRTMDDVDPSTLSLGDAARGRDVFMGKGDCLRCHRVAGRGSRKAPPLTAIGATRSAGALERSLLDPEGSMLPINRSIRAVMRDGREVTGRRLNEDTHTVQLIDTDDRLVSLDKTDLREYTVLTTSEMPEYGDRFSERELSDLLAYLLTLKGVD